MASRKISQREAHKTKKLLRELSDKYRAALSRYATPGTHVWSITLSSDGKNVLETVYRLGFRLLCKLDGDALKLYAVKP